MLASMKGRGRQSKISFPKLSPDEWQTLQMQRAPDPSVECVPTPSVRIVKPPIPTKRPVGRPRKQAQVVDLTGVNTPPNLVTKSSSAGGSGSSGSLTKSRTDWTHPALFLRIIQYVLKFPVCILFTCFPFAGLFVLTMVIGLL